MSGSSKGPDVWWAEYEKNIGEKVRAFLLGQYLGGWSAFDAEKQAPLWGLVIVTDTQFRFHHFPHESWLQAMSRAATGGDEPTEKTFAVPWTQIQDAQIIHEKRWWKRLLGYQPPLLQVTLCEGPATIRFEVLDKKIDAFSSSLGRLLIRGT
jgi:hypothetical protein